MRQPASVFLFCLLVSGCEHRHIVLDSSQVLGASVDRQAAAGLQVSCTPVEQASDPLPIAGTGAEFTSLRVTLEEVVRGALAPWASRSHRPGGYLVKLELYRTRAQVAGGQTTVELSARVRLFGATGEVFIAQTRRDCREVGKEGAEPSEAVYACVGALAHELSGWVEGVKP